jgi:hypothetical protein
LKRDEISRGRLHKAGANGYLEKSYDLLTSFKDVLGKRVREIPANYESGELVRDTAMDLETNVSKEFTTENALLLREGAVSKNAVVKVAQTFRTGTNDIDALDYVFMYLNDEKHSHSELHDINDVYVLDNFRPVVTNKNWRIDCGVAGYDNRLGLLPFFPTRLRFEDYIYRLWIHQDGIVSAHTDAVQTISLWVPFPGLKPRLRKAYVAAPGFEIRARRSAAKAAWAVLSSPFGRLKGIRRCAFVISYKARSDL